MIPKLFGVLVFFSSFSAVFSTLKFVQIWYRHGERLPTHYLNLADVDPAGSKYLDLAYPGELTNRGMYQEFTLGEIMRKNYGDHFGAIYKPTEFTVFTGLDNRTSTSAQSFFAGFWPPAKSQRWNPQLNWIPIAQRTDESLDWVSLGVVENCPVYNEGMLQTESYEKIQVEIENVFADLLVLLRNKTGDPLNTPTLLNHLIDSLKCRLLIDSDLLPFPKWARGYENHILNASYIIHDAVVRYTNEQVGYYHNELIISFIDNYLKNNHTKGIFVSAHDTNIMTIWESIQFENLPKDIPNFGGSISIELHENKGEHTVKFYLSMGFNETRVLIKPTSCVEQVCSLEELRNITNNSRKSRDAWVYECTGLTKSQQTVTGSMIIVLAILLLITIILGYTTFSYKKQLNNLRDPERVRLLH